MASARNRIFSIVFSGILLAFLTLVGGSSVQAADQDAFLVVVHPNVPDSTMNKQDLSDVFMKKRTQWSDGSSVLPVTSGDRDVNRAFSQEVHGRSSAALKKFWQRQIFSGEGYPPPERATDQAIVDYVRSNPGAIGIVSSRANLASADVRVLSVR